MPLSPRPRRHPDPSDRLAARQHGLITTTQAAECGLTRHAVEHRLTARRWVLVDRGLYRLAGSPVTPHQRVLAAVLLAGSEAVASHRTAAALWALPGFEVGVVEITHPKQRRKRAGQLVHRGFVPPGQWVLLQRIRVTTPARTICDLAGTFEESVVARALDDALAMRLTALDKVRRVHEQLWAERRPGARLMGRLLDERGIGYVASESELEARVIQIIASAGLPPPVRQLEIHDGAGLIGRVDFAYPASRLVIEADGRRHHTQRLDREADRIRDNRLARAGWRVARVTWQDLVDDPDEVVRLVRAAA